ncbi:MAG: phage major capsid protein [Rubrivivax sp.]|nr:phage major capsid protein [Rubrivivax sp.]
MTERELADWDWLKLVRAHGQRDAVGLFGYREWSDELAKRVGRDETRAGSVLIPGEVLRRDLTAASFSGGGALVGQTVGHAPALGLGLPVLSQLPVTIISARVGDHVETTHAGAFETAVHWHSNEADQNPGNVNDVFGGVAHAPHSCSVFFKASHRFLRLTSTAARDYLMREAMSALMRGVGAAVLFGTGNDGQPTGIANVAGVGVETGASMSWTKVRAMLAGVEGAGFGGVSWVCGPQAAQVLRTRERAAGSGFILDNDGRIAGYPCLVSREVESDALLVASWPAVRLVYWGAIEMEADPFSSFQSGAVGLRFHVAMDVGVTEPASVAVARGIT